MNAWAFVAALAGAYATPRIGVGVTAAALTAGQLFAGVIWDQFGALGLPMVPISPPRIAGLLLIVVGVVLVRGVG